MTFASLFKKREPRHPTIAVEEHTAILVQLNLLPTNDAKKAIALFEERFGRPHPVRQFGGLA